jgi:hypothetical protein
MQRKLGTCSRYFTKVVKLGICRKDHRPDVFESRALRSSDVFLALGAGNQNDRPNRNYED